VAKLISNKEFYEKSLKEFGISARGVHWKNQQTQYVRFHEITKFIRQDIQDITICDIGCGVGEYYNYLQTKELLPKKYTGVDCENKMIKVCKKRFPNIEFIEKNILYEDIEEVDYCICSGAMNLMTFDQCSLFIKRAYRASKKGFIFNFLQSLTLNDVKPYEILALCNSLSDTIYFKEKYLDNDFTIFMVK
jgi:ubiquinone/menaquinone biosynthesis C-methylase UbiE